MNSAFVFSPLNAWFEAPGGATTSVAGEKNEGAPPDETGSDFAALLAASWFVFTPSGFPALPAPIPPVLSPSPAPDTPGESRLEPALATGPAGSPPSFSVASEAPGGDTGPSFNPTAEGILQTLFPAPQPAVCESGRQVTGASLAGKPLNPVSPPTEPVPEQPVAPVPEASGSAMALAGSVPVLQPPAPSTAGYAGLVGKPESGSRSFFSTAPPGGIRPHQLPPDSTRVRLGQTPAGPAGIPPAMEPSLVVHPLEMQPAPATNRPRLAAVLNPDPLPPPQAQAKTNGDQLVPTFTEAAPPVLAGVQTDYAEMDRATGDETGKPPPDQDGFTSGPETADLLVPASRQREPAPFQLPDPAPAALSGSRWVEATLRDEHTNVLADAHRLQLDLAPDHLGHLEIELVRDQAQGMTARITSHSHQSESLLVENLPSLRQSLEQAGVVVHCLEVRADSGSTSHQRHSSPPPHQPPERGTTLPRESGGPVVEATMPTLAGLPNRRLSLHI